MHVVAGGHNGTRSDKAQAALLSFAVLLRNGQVVNQRATHWVEVTDDEGTGTSYQFYNNKIRVMSLEYTEVRAVFCREYCDVDQAIKALRSSRRRKSNGTSK